MTRAGAAWASESGSSLLEFSLIVPLVVFMFMGIVDFGLAISQGMTVADAADAGAQYGTLAGNSSDIAGMQAVATTAAHGLSGFAVTATTWCSCSPAGAVVSCSSTCTTYGVPVQYVQVKTSAPVSVLMGYSGLPGTIALTGFSAMRVQ